MKRFRFKIGNTRFKSRLVEGDILAENFKEANDILDLLDFIL